MKLPKDLQDKYKRKSEKKILFDENSKPFTYKMKDYPFRDLKEFLVNQQRDLNKNEKIFTLEENQEFLKELQSKALIIKNIIQDHIKELAKIVKKYNPIHLLHFICTKYCFFNPETYKESESKSIDIWVEYALSFITSIQTNSSKKFPNEEIYFRFENLIKEIIELCRTYYMFHDITKSNNISQKSIRFSSIIRYLGWRGDSYEQHHLDLVSQTFKPHNTFLKANFGFTTEEIIDFINNISQEIKNNRGIHKIQNYFIPKFQEILEKYNFSKEDIKTTKNDEYLREFNIFNEEYWNYIKTLDPFYFKLKASKKLPKELLELFSIRFGENRSFQERDAYWPLNNSQIYLKPLIKDKEEYYGFGSTIIYRNIIGILESLIQEIDEDYYNNTFQKKKAKILEKLSLQYLYDIMPKAQIYGGLYYESEENSEKRWYENDGLIIFDNNLFIIEAKAQKLSLPARRGSIPRIKTTVKKIIDEAYNQGIRCKKYIIESKEAIFYNKKRNKVLSINSDNYRSIYIINTTFENLGYLSAQLHNLNTFNLLEGKEWPWTVFINDLRVISEIVESPSTFLLFLQRRIGMNDLELISTSDELDYFMFFLKYGMYFEDTQFSNKVKLSLIGLTDDLDRYYNYLQGYVKEAEKPIFNIHDYIKKFIKKLENSNNRGFTFASIFLLGLDSKDHQLILTLMKKHKDLSFKTGKDYKSFFCYKKSSIGLLFVIRTNKNIKDWNRFRKYLKIMTDKYKLKYGIIYKSIFDRKSDIIPDLDFEIIE